MTSAETIVEGSGVAEIEPEADGGSDEEPLTPSPAGGLDGIGGMQGGGGGQLIAVEVEPAVLPVPYAETAGGADGTDACSAAGGLVMAVGMIALAGAGASGTSVCGAVVVEVGMTVGSGAVAGVSGAVCGTMLVGFRTSAAATLGVVVAVVVGSVVLVVWWWWRWHARADPATPLRPSATTATAHPKPCILLWPHPCDAIMRFAILFLLGKNQKAAS